LIQNPSAKSQASNSKIKECILGALNLILGACDLLIIKVGATFTRIALCFAFNGVEMNCKVKCIKRKRK
jgi:hypothetical protein